MKKALIIMLIACLPHALLGQSLWTNRSDRIGIKLEFLNPAVGEVFPGVDVNAHMINLLVHVPISEIITASVEIPYSSATLNSGTQSISSSTGGNLYFGLEIGKNDSRVSGEVGLRPLARKHVSFGSFYAVYGDFDRGEAYVAEITSFYGAINLRSTHGQGFSYRIRLGPTIWSDKGGESLTLIDYGAKAGYDNEVFQAYAGITGRWNTETQSGKEVFHNLGFEVAYRIGIFRPALIFRIPLDREHSEIIKHTIGGSLSLEL